MMLRFSRLGLILVMDLLSEFLTYHRVCQLAASSVLECLLSTSYIRCFFLFHRSRSWTARAITMVCGVIAATNDLQEILQLQLFSFGRFISNFILLHVSLGMSVSLQAQLGTCFSLYTTTAAHHQEYPCYLRLFGQVCPHSRLPCYY